MVRALRIWRAEVRKATARVASSSHAAELERAGSLIDQACAILEGLARDDQGVGLSR